MMLLRSSAHGLNSLFGLQLPQSKLNLRRSVQLTQLHVTGNVHPAKCEGEGTLSEAHLHNHLLNGSLRRLGLRSGSGPWELCRENFVSNVLLDEILEEELQDSDTQTSIGVDACEGSFVSGRGNDDLMSGAIFEGSGVALMCDRVVGSKTATGTGFGAEDGGGGAGGYGGRGDGSGSNSNSRDAYHKKMLRADPGNPLLLTNYARFLQEVQYDVEKAEEYYGRAILASPGDGDALSSYANLIWDVHKDAPRAESYYEQAVETAPDDCNVLASYAHFLWDAEDDEKDQASCIH